MLDKSYTHTSTFLEVEGVLRCAPNEGWGEGEKKREKEKKRSRSQGTLWYAAKFSLCAAEEIAGVNGNCWLEQSLQEEALLVCFH